MQITICMLPFASSDDKFVVILIVCKPVAVEVDPETLDLFCDALTIRRVRPSIVFTAL